MKNNNNKNITENNDNLSNEIQKKKEELKRLEQREQELKRNIIQLKEKETNAKNLVDLKNEEYKKMALESYKNEVKEMERMKAVVDNEGMINKNNSVINNYNTKKRFTYIHTPTLNHIVNMHTPISSLYIRQGPSNTQLVYPQVHNLVEFANNLLGFFNISIKLSDYNIITIGNWYYCTVLCTIEVCGYKEVQNIGVDAITQSTQKQQILNLAKSAATNAYKRAFAILGNIFGGDTYDVKFCNVVKDRLKNEQYRNKKNDVRVKDVISAFTQEELLENGLTQDTLEKMEKELGDEYVLFTNEQIIELHNKGEIQSSIEISKAKPIEDKPINGFKQIENKQINKPITEDKKLAMKVIELGDTNENIHNPEEFQMNKMNTNPYEKDKFRRDPLNISKNEGITEDVNKFEFSDEFDVDDISYSNENVNKDENDEDNNDKTNEENEVTIENELGEGNDDNDDKIQKQQYEKYNKEVESNIMDHMDNDGKDNKQKDNNTQQTDSQLLAELFDDPYFSGNNDNQINNNNQNQDNRHNLDIFNTYEQNPMNENNEIKTKQDGITETNILKPQKKEIPIKISEISTKKGITETKKVQDRNSTASQTPKKTGKYKVTIIDG